jgi:hypothetical protein
MLQLVATDCRCPLRRAFKRFGWTVAALALISLVVYGALLGFNWRDRSPSPAAIRLTAASQARPVIADADNAYVYMMGFAVMHDADPRPAGVARAAWAARFAAGSTTSPDPIRPAIDIAQSRLPAARELAELCQVASKHCASALSNGGPTLRAWLQDERWLLSRYETLLAHPAWREPTPFDLRIPFPSYSTVLDAQRLFHVRAWDLAHRGDIEALRDLMSSDIRFWRLALRSADVLITKMIAVAALRHHFEFGNLIFRELPPEAIRDAIPEEWFAEISPSERSMLRCFAGEWRYLDKLVRQAKRGDEGELKLDEVSPLTQKMLWRALNPLLQPQDSSNEAADRFVMLANDLDVPYVDFATALGKLREKFRRDDAASGLPAYNTLGTLLAYSAPTDYSAYAVRVADVEGIRRAALLTATLRADRVSESEVATHVAASTIRDPYNLKPFEWDGRAHAVVFTGLEESDQRRHAFVY